MRMILIALSVAIASLVGAEQAAAAPSIDLVVVTGGGELESGSSLGMQFISLDLTNRARTVDVKRGNLTVDGVRTVCTGLSDVVDCSSATLNCEDGDHSVVEGGPGVGSIDGTPLAQGFIQLLCFSR